MVKSIHHLELNSQMTFSFHDDVLSANPSTDEQKYALINEIKTRAKGALSQNNYPESLKLYTKAIDVVPTADTKELAILYGNRSMCYLSMSQASEALSDADFSLSSDPSYTKGYYRKTLSLLKLGRSAEAKECVKIGLSLKPGDKHFLSLAKKVEEGILELPPKAMSAVAKSATAISSSSIKKETNKVHDNDDNDEDLATTKSDKIRGYTKLEGGGVTTFFNNVLDPETKQLIGDIAPKKIDGPEAPPMVAVGSSWNAAGTFESKDMTEWARKKLKESLLVTSAPQELIITEVEEVNGDAEFIVMRGKQKHVCDLATKVKWTFRNEVSGSAHVQDITADADFELVSISASSSNSDPGSSVKEALQKVLTVAIHLFTEEFKSRR